jgi:hypothetical protein
VAELNKISIQAGEHDRSFCPVTIELPLTYTEFSAVELRDAKTHGLIPCQTAPTKGGVLLTWLVTGLKAGATQTVIAKTVKEAHCRPAVTVRNDQAEQRVNVRIFGKPFTSYNYGTQWVRPFLYPVIGPYGTQVTRNWPMKTVEGEHQDHPHHKSVWVAYGECGKVDNWSEEPGHGFQRHRKFVSLESGAVYGEIVARNEWCTNRERVQFEELREMRFYALRRGERLFDIAVTFKMTEGPIVFHDTKEGGLVSVRVASSMDVRNGGRIENGYGGVNEGETWGKHAPWCDYSGLVNGKHVGIAIIDHEANPRYPTQWHVRDYGLMTANCFAWQHYRPEAKQKGDMAFKKGQQTTWRYRLYIHKGSAGMGKVRNRLFDLVAPPKVTLE